MAKGDVGRLTGGNRKGHAHELRCHVGEARGFRIKGKAGRVLKTLDPSRKRRFIQDDFIPPGLSLGQIGLTFASRSPALDLPAVAPCPVVPLALKGPEFRFEF